MPDPFAHQPRHAPAVRDALDYLKRAASALHNVDRGAMTHDEAETLAVIADRVGGLRDALERSTWAVRPAGVR